MSRSLKLPVIEEDGTRVYHVITDQGVTVLDLEDNVIETRALTSEETAFISAADAQVVVLQAQADEQADNLAAAETLRQSMFDLTDDIITWCTAAQLFIQTSGAQGSLSSSTYISLLSQAETLLLSHKNLAIKTDAVNDQRDWMLQRGQQAQSILALAALST
jgi:hypothetical protein